MRSAGILQPKRGFQPFLIVNLFIPSSDKYLIPPTPDLKSEILHFPNLSDSMTADFFYFFLPLFFLVFIFLFLGKPVTEMKDIHQSLVWLSRSVAIECPHLSVACLEQGQGKLVK